MRRLVSIMALLALALMVGCIEFQPDPGHHGHNDWDSHHHHDRR